MDDFQRSLEGMHSSVPVPSQQTGFWRRWRSGLLFPAGLCEVFHEDSEGFRTDVMLDAFGIGLGRTVRHAERPEECHNNFVAAPRFLGKLAAGYSEEDRAVRLSRDQSGALEAANGVADGDVRHSQSPRQVDGTGLAARGNEVSDRLNIVLCDFLRMRDTRALEITGERGRAEFGSFGRQAIHLFTQAETPHIDNPEVICSIGYIMNVMIQS